MPARLAEVTNPVWLAARWNSRAISGTVTPPMNTTKPSKNLPEAASAQIRHCIPVIGVDFSRVPSDHTGNSSMYSCTVFAFDWLCGFDTVTSLTVRLPLPQIIIKERHDPALRGVWNTPYRNS